MIDIKHIAKLSKLRITAQEEEKFAEEMEKIVDMIQNLPQLDDTGALIDPSLSLIHILLGYDHEEGGLKAVQMREKEESVLMQLGIPRGSSYVMEDE